MLRFRYHLYRSNAPHRGGDFITDKTLNLKEESGKEFALTFDGKNAILNTEETYMLFSADAAAGEAGQA